MARSALQSCVEGHSSFTPLPRFPRPSTRDFCTTHQHLKRWFPPQHHKRRFCTVTYFNRGSTFALRRSTLDFGPSGQRSWNCTQRRFVHIRPTPWNRSTCGYKLASCHGRHVDNSLRTITGSLAPACSDSQLIHATIATPTRTYRK